DLTDDAKWNVMFSETKNYFLNILRECNVKNPEARTYIFFFFFDGLAVQSMILRQLDDNFNLEEIKKEIIELILS
ncbi:MAG: hypothetical protein ACTSPI_13895, partial [Candidatus Heimdallarchaeaceae archaeon]